MSSLRLALKQSLEEASIPTIPDEPKKGSKGKRGRKRKKKDRDRDRDRSENGRVRHKDKDRDRDTAADADADLDRDGDRSRFGDRMQGKDRFKSGDVSKDKDKNKEKHTHKHKHKEKIRIPGSAGRGKSDARKKLKERVREKLRLEDKMKKEAQDVINTSTNTSLSAGGSSTNASTSANPATQALHANMNRDSNSGETANAQHSINDTNGKQAKHSIASQLNDGNPSTVNTPKNKSIDPFSDTDSDSQSDDDDSSNSSSSGESTSDSDSSSSSSSGSGSGSGSSSDDSDSETDSDNSSDSSSSSSGSSPGRQNTQGMEGVFDSERSSDEEDEDGNRVRRAGQKRRPRGPRGASSSGDDDDDAAEHDQPMNNNDLSRNRVSLSSNEAVPSKLGPGGNGNETSNDANGNSIREGIASKQISNSRSGSQSPVGPAQAQSGDERISSSGGIERDQDREHQHDFQPAEVRTSRSISPNNASSSSLPNSNPKGMKKRQPSPVSISSSKKSKKSSSSVTSSKKSQKHDRGSANATSTNDDGKSNPVKKRKQKTVLAPTQEVLAWVMGMSQGKQRRKIAVGMRVKVRFLKPTVKWYGGLITAVATGGHKVRIKYDDGTKEIADFPDKEIVVDAEGNGEHKVSAGAFMPKTLPVPISISSRKKLKKKKEKMKEKIQSEDVEKANAGKAAAAQTETVNAPVLGADDKLSKDSDIVMQELKLDVPEVKKDNEEVETTSQPMEVDEITNKQSLQIVEIAQAPKPSKSAKPDSEPEPQPQPEVSLNVGKEQKQEKTSVMKSAMEPVESKSAPIPFEQRPDSTKPPQPEENKSGNIDIAQMKPSGLKPKKTIGAGDTEPVLKPKTKDKEQGLSGDAKVKPLIVVPKPLSVALVTKPITPIKEKGADNITKIPPSSEGSNTSSLNQKSIGGEVEKEHNANKRVEISTPSINRELKDDKGTKPESAAIVPSNVENKDINDVIPVVQDISERPNNDTLTEKNSAESPTTADIENSSNDDGSQDKQDLNRNGKRVGRKPQQKVLSKDGRPFADKGKKRRKEKEDGRKGKKSDTKEDVEDWVQCNKCEKWRLIPSVKDLPEKWYCKMNVTDAKRNNCEAPEQTPEEVARERRKAKKAAARKLGKSRSFSPASTTPKKPKEKGQDQSEKRKSPSFEKSIAKTESGDDSQSGSIRKKRVPSQNSLNEDNSSDNDAVPSQPRRGVGRRGRRSNEEKGEGRGKRGKKQKEEKQQEWVQCEKCEKWRRLPRSISAEDLPDKWFCSMNTWDPRSASCAVQEDYKIEDEKTKEGNNFKEIGPRPPPPSSALTYRNLIRRPTRPISERMRAAESIFSSHAAEAEDEQSGAPPVVLYANSSMFQQKIAYHRMAEQNENNLRNEVKIPLFSLMSHSQLWKDLSCGVESLPLVSSSPTSTTMEMNNKSLSVSSQMKAMVFYAVGTKQLSASEILLECQCSNWDHNNWMELRAASTYELICATLDELVKDGLIQKILPPSVNAFATIRYRRATAGGTSADSVQMQMQMQSTANELLVRKRCLDTQNRYESRKMKFSKPWKKKPRLG